MGPNWPFFINSANAQPASVNPPRMGVSLKPLVDALLDETPADANDLDGDNLPDSVERVIGTDPNNTDSDFDRLEDYWEIDNGLDPLDPDSNLDGLPDYYEVNDVNSPDADEDGIENAWDFDNDGDGVNDGVDMSPFAKTDVNGLFHFDITTNGGPAYITFQLIPKTREYLKLFGQAWDWPNGDHEASVQDWDNSKEDIKVFPLLQLSVNDAPEANEVILNGIAVDGNTVSIPLMPVTEHGNIVAFAARMLYPSSTPSNLMMDARLIWKIVGKNDPNSSVLGEDTLLATYKDSFSLAGMTIEESCGTDAGLFYSPDVNQTVAANLLMAYQFLRNSANHATDMPNVLNSNNITITHQLASFTHRDAALVLMSNDMIPAALDSLPADANLPVITILEDRSVSRELSEFEQVSDNSFSVDLAAEPVMTTKTLQTNWYSTSDKQAMPTGDVMAEILKLGQNETTSYLLMTLMLYWNTGEQSLEGAGIPPTVPGGDYDLVPEVVEDIFGGSLSALEVFYQSGVGIKGLQVYRSISLLQSKGWSISMGSKSLPDLAKMGNFKKFKTWVKMSDNIEDTSKLFKRLDNMFNCIEAAALFADAGFAAYSLIAISQMSDISGIALYNSVMKVVVKYYYNCMLFLIGAIPFVGWFAAIAIELSDVFGDWSEDFVNWIIDGISDVDYVVTPDVNIVGEPMVTVDDKDDNGTDVGDRIDFRSRLKGTIYGTESYWRLVQMSDIYPYYKIYAPTGSSSVTGSPYQRRVLVDWDYYYIPITNSQITSNKPAGWRAMEHESGVWIEPGTAMPNFPVYMELNILGELWYAWSWYSFFIFDWGWQHEESCNKVESVLGGFTFYADVLPATFDDFVRWRGISQLDHDGDGLADANESSSPWPQAGTSDPWLYDTDADGLNDKFEVDNGLNPRAYDTDGDVLIDWFEVQFGTDPKNADTDGDGMTDGLEVAGWLIQFEYAGETFTTRSYSDPAIPDTDSDGIDDYLEYWSGLNARSKDTNGDGVNDVANPQIPETTVEFVKKVDFDMTESGGIEDIAVDANGFVYTLVHHYYPEDYSAVKKLDTDLNELSSWAYPNSLSRDILIDDESRLLHICNSIGPLNSHADVLTVSLIDGTAVGGPWAARNETLGIWNLALGRATNGNIYVGRSGNWSNWGSPNWDWGINSFVDVYDANRNLVDTWGDYAWNHEINKLAYVEDIAYNPVNGLLYVCDLGMDLTMVFIGPRFRPDRIALFTTDGQYLQDMPGYHKDSVDFTYQYLSSVDIDSDGFIYICDGGNYRIHKLDPNGMSIVSWGGQGLGDGQFELGPRKAVVDANMNVFVLEPSYAEGDPIEHIHKFRQVFEEDANEPVIVDDDIADRDGDGLLNDDETAGWDVTFTDANSTKTIAAVSNPLLTDTDLDGLDDSQEYELGTNPQDPDTDDDGLSDLDDPNPLHFDTDGDGLPDGTETTYGSDPNSSDTDGEGLSDTEEFALGADPNNADTDSDGLDDAIEWALDISLISPDSDGDFMFDGQEVDSGTDPNNGDTDDDGLGDGMESSVHGTNPSSDDSDNDGLGDDVELELRLNPLSDDTDNDGIPDANELEEGTNPWNEDSDRDGVPDGQDDPNNAAPDVNNARPSREYLWPPNNKFVEITIEGLTDPDGDPVQVAISSVTSDEPAVLSSGDKQTPDVMIDESGNLLLRAERSASGNGRVYELSFVAGDNKGGITPGKVKVKVPHDKRGNGYICIDDGQQYELYSIVQQ